MSVIQIPGTISEPTPDKEFNEDNDISDEEILGEDIYEDCDGSEEEREGRKKRRSKNGNGVDMTPPDVHLSRAEKLAAKFAKAGKPDEALRQLVRCTALCALVFGPEHWRYALSYANLAAGYIDLKGAAFAAQAEQHADLARSMFLAGLPQTNSEAERASVLKAVLTTYFVLGRSQALLKKFSEAENSVQKCLSLLSQLSRLSCVDDTYHDATAIKLNTCLARISSKLDKSALAISHYETAIKIGRRHFGSDSLDLIPLLQGLGQTEQDVGLPANHERAVELFLQAHEIAVTNSKEAPTEEIADTARSLAMVYSRTGDGTAEISAESYLNEALTAYTQLYGPEHPTVCQLQSDLARLEIRTGRSDDGVKRLRSNIKAQKAVFGEFSEAVLDSQKMIASLKLAEGNLEHALTAFNRCLQIQEMLFGPNSRKTKETKKTLDTILAHPQMANKQTGAELKSRPRFNSVFKPSNRTGVFN